MAAGPMTDPISWAWTPSDHNILWLNEDPGIGRGLADAILLQFHSSRSIAFAACSCSVGSTWL
jgi:hypothetical protein